VPVLLGGFGRYRQRSIDTRVGQGGADGKVMTGDVDGIGGVVIR